MDFEVKNIATVGRVISNGEVTGGTMTQHINITIGPVGCPYDDIKVDRTVEYTFSVDLTAKQAEDGMVPFAAQWVIDNYPNT